MTEGRGNRKVDRGQMTEGRGHCRGDVWKIRSANAAASFIVFSCIIDDILPFVPLSLPMVGKFDRTWRLFGCCWEKRLRDSIY